MKWLSLKKYVPPPDTIVFIRAQTNQCDFLYYERYFAAMIEDLKEVKKLYNWKMSNGQNYMDIKKGDYEVTHFAIPDAVEIEA